MFTSEHMRALGLKQNAATRLDRALSERKIGLDELVDLLEMRGRDEIQREKIDTLLAFLEVMEVCVDRSSAEEGFSEVSAHNAGSAFDRHFRNIHADVVEEKSLLGVYLDQIDCYTVLTPSEEHDLWRRIKENDDQEARETICQHHLKLVVAIARRYRGRGMELMDLVQEGNLGLMDAIKHFDYAKGFPFPPYALWWIRRSIVCAIAECGNLVRVPLRMEGMVEDIYRAYDTLVDMLGREATAEEITTFLSCSADDVRKTLRNLRISTVSLADLARKFECTNEVSRNVS